MEFSLSFPSQINSRCSGTTCIMFVLSHSYFNLFKCFIPTGTVLRKFMPLSNKHYSSPNELLSQYFSSFLQEYLIIFQSCSNEDRETSCLENFFSRGTQLLFLLESCSLNKMKSTQGKIRYVGQVESSKNQYVERLERFVCGVRWIIPKFKNDFAKN